MTNDQLGWIAVLLLILSVVAALLEYNAVAWSLAIIGICIIVYAKVVRR